MARQQQVQNPNEELVQIEGNDGNVLTFPSSMLEAAGINIRNNQAVTAEQVELLLSMVNDGPQADQNRKRHYAEPAENPPFSLLETNQGVRLIDRNGSVFDFDPTQLSQRNIHLPQLTSEHYAVMQLVALAVQQGAVLQGDSAQYSKKTAHGHSDEPSGSGLNNEFPGREMTPANVAEVGDEVQFRRAGKLLKASVRYIRAQTGYKVQFDDGHFEWIDECDILQQNLIDTGDHQRYSDFPGCGPKVRVVEKEANFTCPICTKKIYQKRPAHIVIRIPACDQCSKEKVMVLDGEETTQNE
ncbi:unnamed protein product, partial [Mesorhabditis spiculigera]